MKRVVLLFLLLLATVVYLVSSYSMKAGKGADGKLRAVFVEKGSGRIIKLWGK